MPKPRFCQVSLDATPYYHCVSRCVRRAFLCGKDTYSNQSYEHRRQWVEDDLHRLAKIFAIDLCGYAIMSNHYHVVLHVDDEKALSWSDKEVVNRWHQLYKGNSLSQRFSLGESLGSFELEQLSLFVETWRKRLMSLSWFMGYINEGIARRANVEDKVTGRFWEGRFKSQALLDERALLACLVYVDLNPIRAKMATTPEESSHTSIKKRISHALNQSNFDALDRQPTTLFPFIGNPDIEPSKGLPFRLSDYLDLVDWSGRNLREDKRSTINNDSPPILERLDLDVRHWHYLTRHYESRFKTLVGAAYTIRQTCAKFGYRRPPGLSVCQEFFP